MFGLKFKEKDIPVWALKYPVADDRQVEYEIGPNVRKRGYFTQPELVDICAWKTRRTKPRVAGNAENVVVEVTKFAFSTSEEYLRLQALTLLNGVGWPTASVLLHFGHRDPYPILDYRALWSLGVDSPPTAYTFDFWWEYVLFCRRMAEKAGVTMRELDRALWKYSKENQK